MPTRLTQTSFTRGELSPRLDARTQLEQYTIGLKTAKNALIHQEGGISNRMGLEFCGEVKYSSKITRLMKFVFNSEQTYMLEFGHKYIRFIKDGGYIINSDGNIVEIETPYDENDLMQIKRSQSGDYLTLTHPSYAPKNLVRKSHYKWELNDILFEPNITAPTDVAAKFNGTTPTSNKRTYKYLVTAVEKDTNEESYRSDIASVVAHREANWVAGEEVNITWSAVTGASEYNIYKEVNGLYGYIGTADGTSFVDDNIEADLTACAPVAKNPFENDNNPSCSCYFQQRKMYANSENNPQTLWASQTGASNNFNVSRPLVATNAVTIAMDDREMNEIRHIVPMKDLIVLTSNSEWKVNGTDGSFQANPTPAAVIQSCYGASNVEPVVSGNMVIFVQSGGSVIRDLGYDYLSEGYDGDELSLFSSHLFEGKEVIDMAYAKEPNRLLYVIFDDGSCALMTYNKKQKLCGWTRIVTDGIFEAVDVVREGLEDIAYFVIKRTVELPYIDSEDISETLEDYIDCGTLDDMYEDYIDCGDLELREGTSAEKYTRYIERTKTRVIANAKDGFLVDSGLSNVFSNYISKVSGLDHLEGKKVVVNADGGIITDLVVEDGTIKLPKKAKSIIVGLPYEFEIETLNIEGENTQGLKKLVNYVSAKIYNSREDFVFCGANNTEFRHSRCTDSVNDSSKLFSKDISTTVFATPDTNATVKIKQNYPLPITILSLSALIDVQDNENS